MHIASAFICNHVEVQSSMLYVHGGFPEWWTIPGIPHQQAIGLGLVAEIEPGEEGTTFTLEFSVHRDNDSTVLGHGQIQLTRGPSAQFVADAPMYMPMAFSIAVNFEDVGPHRIRIAHGDTEVSEIRFGVRVG